MDVEQKEFVEVGAVEFGEDEDDRMLNPVVLEAEE